MKGERETETKKINDMKHRRNAHTLSEREREIYIRRDEENERKKRYER